MKKFSRVLFSSILIGAIAVSSVFPATAQIMSEEIKSADVYGTYDEYAADLQENSAVGPFILTTDEIVETAKETAIVENYNGEEGKSIQTKEGSTVTWKTAVPAGWYTLKVRYYPEYCRSNYAGRKILVNGEVPYDTASAVNFYTTYIDEKGIVEDYYGNDIRSAQVKNPIWRTVSVYDKEQYEETPLKFYLDENSTLSFVATTGDMTIKTVELVPYKKLESYKKVLEGYKKAGYKESAKVCDIYQAEECTYKTDPTLLPTTDNGASTEPISTFKIKLNKISGANFKTAGQVLTWKINAPESGLYNITLKSRQNTSRGTYSTRRIYINGEVPFAEANNMKFTYSSNWDNKTLGGDTPWLFYLKKGENEISLEVTLGDMGDVLRRANNILDELNTIYRELLVIIGSTPDKYRDYKLDTLLPETLKKLKVERDNLASVRDDIHKVAGEKGDNLSIFDTIIRQLDEFIEDSDNIPSGFTYFKTNIGSFGTWITSAMAQPLDMDYIVISSPEKEIPKANVNFFKRIYYAIVSFIASFVVDYNNIGNLTENTSDPIVVWLTSGRDQMQVMKVMIQNTFVQETGINVQLENVDAASVLKAVAAGNGPDVMTGSPSTDPVNYALRNAVYDLNQHNDPDAVSIEEIKNRFIPESIVPFSFNGGLYALPQTIDFKVLYYRSDILNDMGITELPETWDDVIEITSALQKNNMTFGLPVADVVGTYSTLMYQNGAELYNKNGSKCLLSEVANTDAFEMMTDFFKNYSLELSYNFVNRFRTGEMPIAIDMISAYNNLKVSAPEIEGLWGIALIPGIMQEDGTTINRTGYMSGTGSMIFNSSNRKNDAYKFLEWWTRAESQVQFGTEIESILGPSSRYMAANKEAFYDLPWTDAELEVIKTQLESSRSVPQVPGSYFIARHLNNAFRAVVISGEDLKDSLIKYNEVINEELSVKRKEFGLED